MGALQQCRGEEAKMEDMFEFARYAKDYLQAENGLTPRQAQILVLDPEVGPGMDEHIIEILDDNIAMNALIARDYRSTHLQDLNEFLDSLAAEYATREPRILDFLQVIGHPIATGVGVRGLAAKSGCLSVLALLLIPLGVITILLTLRAL
jgi:hypothetical protein